MSETRLPIHPYAELFPPMVHPEFDRLCGDIAVNWIWWALREAAANAGAHVNATTAIIARNAENPVHPIRITSSRSRPKFAARRVRLQPDLRS